MAWKLAGIIALALAGTAAAEVDQAKLAELLGDKHRGEQWKAVTETDEMTDVSSTSLVVTANDYVSGVIGQKAIPELVIGCVRGEVIAMVMAKGVYFGSGSKNALVRVDSREATEHSWFLSRYAASPNDDDGFVRSILKADVVKVRLPRHGETDATISFTVAGLDRQIGKLEPNCRI